MKHGGKLNIYKDFAERKENQVYKEDGRGEEDRRRREGHEEEKEEAVVGLNFEGELSF